MSTVKYAQGDPYAHEQYPSFYGRMGSDGVPLRGPTIPMVPGSVIEEVQSKTYDAHVHLWNLADFAQREEYRRVRDMAAAGLARIDYIERNLNPPSQLFVYVEWVTIYYELPARLYPASGQPQ